jgi:hypothetical protein
MSTITTKDGTEVYDEVAASNWNLESVATLEGASASSQAGRPSTPAPAAVQPDTRTSDSYPVMPD